MDTIFLLLKVAMLFVPYFLAAECLRAKRYIFCCQGVSELFFAAMVILLFISCTIFLWLILWINRKVNYIGLATIISIMIYFVFLFRLGFALIII